MEIGSCHSKGRISHFVGKGPGTGRYFDRICGQKWMLLRKKPTLTAENQPPIGESELLAVPVMFWRITKDWSVK